MIRQDRGLHEVACHPLSLLSFSRGRTPLIASRRARLEQAEAGNDSLSTASDVAVGRCGSSASEQRATRFKTAWAFHASSRQLRCKCPMRIHGFTVLLGRLRRFASVQLCVPLVAQLVRQPGQPCCDDSLCRHGQATYDSMARSLCKTHAQRTQRRPL